MVLEVSDLESSRGRWRAAGIFLRWIDFTGAVGSESHIREQAEV